MRVLLVDDDDATRLLCRRVLLSVEPALSIMEAPDGTRALELLRAEAFDGILTDYRMGQVSGLDVLRTALVEQPAAYRALMSGFADPMLLRAAESQAQVHAFIEKPMTKDEFMRVLSDRFVGPMARRRAAA